MFIGFQNKTGNIPIKKHVNLPLIMTGEFNFYRCIEFNPNMYGKTISELHAGNLRLSREDNRYSTLFPGQKLSYWADSPATGRAEIKKWGAGKNILTFWAYDDGSSFLPTVYPRKELQIIDGNQIEFNHILKKLDRNIELSKGERELIDDIAYQEPDCLVYESEARRGHSNFLFFEHGFRKLSLREVKINLGERGGRNHNRIICAESSDYSPILFSYGKTFLPIAKIGNVEEYNKTDEFKLRLQVYLDSALRIAERR
ncbi:hypothetical protein SAMN05660668_00675 [Pseudobutyrivibrio sp. AR14]|uniref:hypothetical protein n=1 Tax=Pseudobutyrivibrio sp. AR14 TaxID=1520804 RepID=UPI0008899B24|nr:hypothetical protein [Pseudobutyrivibrio sp. AR14]SCX89260.1 hypothetical protein SAMN05660668_00675 [Pseudobutyrivibrio sp. AR14]